jgi:predicted permease
LFCGDGPDCVGIGPARRRSGMATFGAGFSAAWDRLRQDLRYALRGWRRAPGATAVAIATLGIGIGATTAIFTLTDALVLRPIPVERPNELRVLRSSVIVRGVVAKSGTQIAWPLYRELRQHSDVFSSAAAFSTVDDLTLHVDRSELHASSGVLFVSDNYLTVLGVAPRLGRGFVPGDDGMGAEAREATAALISDRFWKRAFDGRRDVLGRVLRVGDASFTIVGITPPGFFGAVLGRAPDLFLPLGAMATAQPGLVNLRNQESWSVQVIGRLRPGVSEGAANERLTTLARSLPPPPAATPAPAAGPSPKARPSPPATIDVLPIETGLSTARTRYVQPLGVLLVMSALLLFIACANVGLMRLSQSATRQVEMGVRVALGAARSRLLQQTIVEASLLAVGGGLVGLLVTPRAIDLLLALLPPGSVSLALDVSADPRVLWFAAGISAATVLVFGLLPGRQAIKVDSSAALVNRERSPRLGTARLGHAFIVAQVTISLIVVSGAVLLVRTLYGLATVDPGYKPQHVLLVTVDPGKTGYTGPRLDTYYQQMLDRFAATRGVAAVTLSQGTFLTEQKTTGGVGMPGFTDEADERHWVRVFQVGPRFFDTLGMDIVRGRDFTAQDMTDGPAVAAINETAARRYYGSANPIGRIITSDADFEIVAVVKDTHNDTLREATDATLFVPYRRVRQRGTMVMAARLSGDEGPTTAALLREARTIDPLVPIRTMPLQTLVDQSLSRERLLALISGFFGVATVLLMAVGLFSVVSLAAQRRTAEIGVRLALGARRTQVIWLVLRHPLRLALLGAVIGLPLAIASARGMASLLYDVRATDLLTLVGATLGVLLIVACAAGLPAWRASRLDPLVALRHD